MVDEWSKYKLQINKYDLTPKILSGTNDIYVKSIQNLTSFLK